MAQQSDFFYLLPYKNDVAQKQLKVTKKPGQTIENYCIPII